MLSVRCGGHGAPRQRRYLLPADTVIPPNPTPPQLTPPPSADPTPNGLCDGVPRVQLPTCLGAHLVQQLHHPFALHGSPAFDGRPSSDLAVLLLDLGGAPLGDERPQFAAKKKDQKQEKNSEGFDSGNSVRLIWWFSTLARSQLL